MSAHRLARNCLLAWKQSRNWAFAHSTNVIWEQGEEYIHTDTGSVFKFVSSFQSSSWIHSTEEIRPGNNNNSFETEFMEMWLSTEWPQIAYFSPWKLSNSHRMKVFPISLQNCMIFRESKQAFMVIQLLIPIINGKYCIQTRKFHYQMRFAKRIPFLILSQTYAF